jgi:hypothetical protein
VPQQDCAEPPQAPQTLPVAEVTQPPVVHGVAPPQQAWPSPPQAAQVPAVPCWAFRPEQAKPALQVPFWPAPQQAWPEPPQAAEHTFPAAEITH